MNNSIVIRNHTVTSEQIVSMGAETLHTYVVIASLADDDGRCALSQQMLASYMGVTRETANRRINRLLSYRWQSYPVLHSGKVSDGIVYEIK